MTFIPRWNTGITLAGWTFLLAAAAWLSWKPFLWHVDYFKKPGPHYHQLLLAGLPALCLAILFYGGALRRYLWRYELRALAALALTACTVYEPLATLVTIWLSLAAYAVGGSCLDRLSLPAESPAERLPLATTTGLGIFLLVMLVLGLAGAYNRWVLAAVLTFPLVASRSQISRFLADLRAIDSAWSRTKAHASGFFAAPICFAAIFLVFTIGVAVTPSIARDAVRHHLAAISFYDARGALEILPSDRYSYYPQGAEVLMTLPYSFAGAAGAQLINPMVFLLALLVVYRVARHCSIDRAPAAAAVIFAGTIPFLHWTGSILKNDFLVVLCQLAALLCYLRYRGSLAPNWLRLGVFFIGISASIKHVAIFGAVALAPLYLLAVWRSKRRWALLVSCALILLIAGTPFHLRTYLLTGDPFFPASAQATVDPQGAGLAAQVPPPHWRLPWTVHFEGWWAFEAPTNNPMGMYLFLFWPVWLFLRRRAPNRAELACLGFLAMFFLYWGYIFPIVRYAIAAIMVLGVLTAARLWDLYRHGGRWLRLAIHGGVAYSFLFSMLVAMTIEVNAPQLKYLAGMLDREQYLGEAMDSYPAVAFLNGEAGPNDRILSFYNYARGYSHYPENFYRVRRPDRRRDQELIQRLFAEGPVRFLVVPNQEVERFIELVGIREARSVHRDEAYTVLELPAGNAVPSAVTIDRSGH